MGQPDADLKGNAGQLGNDIMRGQRNRAEGPITTAASEVMPASEPYVSEMGIPRRTMLRAVGASAFQPSMDNSGAR